jgi:hypothetical protein
VQRVSIHSLVCARGSRHVWSAPRGLADDFRSALVAISSEHVTGVEPSVLVSLRVMFQFLRTQATVVARRPLLLLQQVCVPTSLCASVR